MAEKFSLVAKKREKTKHSARETRNEKCIPGVVYGHQVGPILISVNYSDFLRLFRKTGKSSLINLSIEGKEMPVLVHDYMRDPVQECFMHLDFFAVNLKEKVVATVPFVFEGESSAVKDLGGVFTVNHHEIDIRCLPAEIPHDIKVNISSLEQLQDHITIHQLNLSKNFEVMGLDSETVICSVSTSSKSSILEDAATDQAGTSTESTSA